MELQQASKLLGDSGEENVDVKISSGGEQKEKSTLNQMNVSCDNEHPNKPISQQKGAGLCGQGNKDQVDFKK
eukprot:3546127-Ditylum_brightwellii.AAC.1